MNTTHSLAESRAIARAEVTRVLIARKEQLSEILAHGLSSSDVARVAEHSNDMHGVLGDLWRQFTCLPCEDQIAALQGECFKGMAWQSLMQSNPYAVLPRWNRIELRGYE